LRVIIENELIAIKMNVKIRSLFTISTSVGFFSERSEEAIELSIHGLIAVVIFFIVYLLIVLEKHHRTVIVMLGAVALLISGVFENQVEAIMRYVDFNTIFLLMGMMILVSVMKRSGFFQFLGLYMLRITRGNVVYLFLSLGALVALTSAFLDNVTTVLVILPITFAICDSLELNPVPFVLNEIFSSNIGGTATIIGDPPNIMIASAAKLNFMDFIKNVAPAVMLVFVAVESILLMIYRKEIFKKHLSVDYQRFDPGRAIEDRKLFNFSIILLTVVIVLFSFQHVLKIESSVIALLIGFVALSLLGKDELEDILKDVEWSTLLFFFGLFIIVGGLEETGILERLAEHLVTISMGSFKLAEILILNMSGIASAFVDNIPYTATMIPIIEKLPNVHPTVFSNLHPLWWALSLGACLGGNGTPIGASANVVGLALLKRFTKREISFKEFMKVGSVVLVLSLVVSSVYMILRY